MTGGTDSTPRSPTVSKRALAALAVVGLVVASLAPAVGASAVGVPTTGVSVSNPLNGTDERNTTSTDRTTTPEVTMPVVTPTETPTERASTTESTSGRDATARTTTAATSTEETTSTATDDSGRGRDDRTATPARGPPEDAGPSGDGGPPDENGPPGNDDSPRAVHPPGLGGPPDVTDPGETDPPGRVGDGTTPPGLSENRSGPPADRPGQSPNRPGRPGNGSGFPGNGAFPGNATDAPGNRTLPENATRRGRPVRSADVPTVDVTVENASANESVAVNVSTPADRNRTVSFSTLEVTPTRNASFTLNVTASERPIAEKTPTEELSNGTEPLAFLSVDHSISDRNISSVNFTFRLRRDRVNASERDEIALYRYHDDSWNELPTTLVETTASHYVYRVRSPGLSEFAAGKQRPKFEITNATVDISTLSVGDALKVRVRITNEGDADGTFTAELVLGDRPVAERQLTIAAGGMRQTTFERTVAEPGVYEVHVNEYRVGEVAVNGTAASSATEGATGDEPTDVATDPGESETDGRSSAETTAGVPGFGVGVAVVALLGSLAVARWRE
ncbi:PGF-pre-PGF domain-containing protein [Halorussus gelatinilyticus]|uniref:PGF-pre-PGF domain-containing protein n=1 Tax=Halorussus gelatinilyticus TaxID=2937524 RepID=A0A8U0IDP2_9EURY|nr:PGF-pre-PGF domain-containing protein [Halorussus gelatinilyticus]UPV99037.1 PGF-pre-PGF domain-containing protein [Halorussus gelatinilyticus]